MTDGDDAFLELAARLADAAGAIAMEHFRTAIAIDSKSDASPVTAADRAAEAVMRKLIAKTFPGHGILGEEHGAERIDAEYVWVLDPIDGTQSFATGKPLFGTLIALLHRGAPIIGIMDCPALKERWIGMRNWRTTFNGADVSVRPAAEMSDAWLYATSPHMFPVGDFEAFERLRKQARRTIYGAECCAYGYLANGYTDIVCESTMQPYDYFALVPIVDGAGGVMTDWRGDPLTLESDGRTIAAGDKRLHAQAIDILNG